VGGEWARRREGIRESVGGWQSGRERESKREGGRERREEEKEGGRKERRRSPATTPPRHSLFNE